MANLKTSKFRFRKHDQIGAADAESDEEFLADCFVDNGDLAVLRDCGRRERILVGRTGTGKTALVTRLAAAEEHVVRLSPEQLALTFLSNSPILKYLTDIGVDLDQFFRLLWRHILTVELIKERHRIRTEEDKKSFLESLYTKLLGDKRKEKTLNYLVQWGDEFWKATEYRVTEVTKRLEKRVRASLGAKGELLNAGISGDRSLGSEEKSELFEQAQKVVNETQVEQLFHVLDILRDDVFDDPLYRVFITIDDLDLAWTEDLFRYKLIRALIEAVREFAKVRNAKVIIAVRRDLLDRVIRETRDFGFQEEKFRDYYLTIGWTRDELLTILDRRIDNLVRRRYTQETVTHYDILPDHVDGQPLDDFLIGRTMHRPRDIILLFNECLRQSIGAAVVNRTALKAAEHEYSTGRLRSLADEWRSVYPELLDFRSLLKAKPERFRLSDISSEEIEDLCLEIATQQKQALSVLGSEAIRVADGSLTTVDFRNQLIRVFYRVGLIGLKTEAFDTITWSFVGRESVPEAELGGDTHVSVCPAFLRVLGVKPMSRT